MSDKEQPGFSKDSKTEKYSVEKSQPVYECRKKTRLGRKEEKTEVDASTKNTLDGSSVPHFLRRNELGNFTSASVVTTDYYKCRVKTKTFLDRSDLRTNQNKVSGVEYVKNGQSSIFGLWRTGVLMNPFALGECPPLNYEPVLFSHFLKGNRYIEDICEMNLTNPGLVFVLNDTCCGAVSLACKDSYSDTGFAVHEFDEINGGPTHCCTAVSSNGINLVVGGDYFVDYYDETTLLHEYEASSKTMTLSSADHINNCVISGQSNGYAYIHDLRIKSEAFSKQIEFGCNCCLVDSYFLAPDKVIFSAVSNRLTMYDVRVFSPLIEYLGHNQGMKKQPISIANDFLCATGSDNVVRIWNLNGGMPIHEFFPNVSSCHVRGCVRAEGNKTFLYVFESSKRTVFELC